MAESESDRPTDADDGLTAVAGTPARNAWEYKGRDTKHSDGPRWTLERGKLDGGRLTAFITTNDADEHVFIVGNLDELHRCIVAHEDDVANLEVFAQRWVVAHPEGHDPGWPDAPKWSNPEGLKFGPCECGPLAEDWHLLKSPTTDDYVVEPLYECQTCGEKHTNGVGAARGP